MSRPTAPIESVARVGPVEIRVRVSRPPRKHAMTIEIARRSGTGRWEATTADALDREELAAMCDMVRKSRPGSPRRTGGRPPLTAVRRAVDATGPLTT